MGYAKNREIEMHNAEMEKEAKIYYKDFINEDWVRMGEHLPENYNWRQFKFFKTDEENRCIKIKKIISALSDLRMELLKFEPQHAYISVARFLNPHAVGQKPRNFYKPGYMFSQNLFLGADLVVDIDTKEKGNLEKILNKLQENFKKIKTYETKRGYHVWVNDFQDYINKIKEYENPFLRETFNRSMRIMALGEMQIEGMKFDYHSSIDTRRVVRIPYSIYNNEFIIAELKKGE